MIKIRKTGAKSYPWNAWCMEHPPRHEDDEELYFTDVGVVIFSTRGIGNRSHKLAMLAAQGHWNRHHRNRA